MTTYKNHTITKTETTTGGHDGFPFRHVFAVEGRHGKSAGVRPFLTSVAECRDYINRKIEAEENLLG